MKRIVVLVLCILLLSTATAESIDVSNMDFDALQTLKAAVELEFHSRPEAAGISLLPGYYAVGQDIKPGRYYVKMVEPSGNGYSVRLHVYADREKYESRPAGKYGEYIYDDYFSIEDDAISMLLEEGNFLWLEEGSIVFSVSEINLLDLYEVPEGTYVPAGSYVVGEDIPAGKYTAYSGTIFGGEVKVYYSENTFKSNKYDKRYEIEVEKPQVPAALVLEDGYVVFVEKDIVMRKQAKLSFD